MSKSCLLLFVFLAGLFAVNGCALEKAVDLSADMARTITLAVVEKSPPLTNIAAGAQADVTNPTYRVMAVAVNGILLEIGIVGLDVDSHVQGVGQGVGPELSPDAAAEIRHILGDDIADAVIAALAGMYLEPLAEPVAPVKLE